MKKSGKITGKRGRLRGILRLCLLVMISLIAGINFYLLNAQRIGGDSLPMPFGCGAAVVLSGSMEPTLSVDDLLIIKQLPEYKEGDIVVYQSKSSLIVHRIIALDGDTVQTQGDANNAPDEPVNISSVKGAVAAVIPRIGVLVRLGRTPIGIVCILAGLTILFEWSYRKGNKEDEEELEKIRKEIQKLRQEAERDEDEES